MFKKEKERKGVFSNPPINKESIEGHFELALKESIIKKIYRKDIT